MIRSREVSAKTKGMSPRTLPSVVIDKQLNRAGSHVKRIYGQDNHKSRGHKVVKFSDLPVWYLLPNDVGVYGLV